MILDPLRPQPSICFIHSFFFQLKHNHARPFTATYTTSEDHIQPITSTLPSSRWLVCPISTALLSQKAEQDNHLHGPATQPGTRPM